MQYILLAVLIIYGNFHIWLRPFKHKQVNLLEPLKYIPPVEKPANEIEVVDEDVLIDNSDGDEATAQTSLF